MPGRRLRRLDRGAAERDQCIGPLPNRIHVALIERRQVRRQIRRVHLRPLGHQRGRHRNADRARDVAEHRVERRGVGVLLLRQRGIGDRADRHEQERKPEGLRHAHQRQRVEIDLWRQPAATRTAPRQGTGTRTSPPTASAPAAAIRGSTTGISQRHQDRAGRQDVAGERRGVAQHRLRQLRDHHGARSTAPPPMAKISTEPTAKLRSLSTRRFTTGRRVHSSQATAPTSPITVSAAVTRMKPDASQSSILAAVEHHLQAARGRARSARARPRRSAARPARAQGGSSTSAATAKKVSTPIGTLMKNIQRQV